MSQATSRPKREKGRLFQDYRGVREIVLILVGTVALYLFVALLSYHRDDPGWSNSGSGSGVVNSGGVVGAWATDILFILIGIIAYLVPLLIAYLGWLLYRGKAILDWHDREHLLVKTAGLVIVVAAGAGVAYLNGLSSQTLPQGSGGILGDFVGSSLVNAFSYFGAMVFLLALSVTGITLLTGISWLWLIDTIGHLTLEFFARIGAALTRLKTIYLTRKGRLQGHEQGTLDGEAEVVYRRPSTKIEPIIHHPLSPARRAPTEAESAAQPLAEPAPVKPAAQRSGSGKRQGEERQIPIFDPDISTAPLPSLSLLDEVRASGNKVSAETLEGLSRLVETRLRDFGVEVVVESVHPGPVITRFELQPAPGLKVSKISNLSKDLARSLSTSSVRVVEVIPGKTTIGLEIPNEHRDMVQLSETFRSDVYQTAKSPLTLALGKDIAGEPVVADLAKMPHLLVAGTTGSGKSVAINAMILSLLYNATPREVRLIMVDPKMLELSIYEGIPHLLAPVVTDMKDASNALRWCVAEMERRYKLMAALGVRNIAGYNTKVEDAERSGEPLRDPLFQPDPLSEAPQQPDTLETLPFIVVVVDELADMMMVVGKKVEELIARLAQKARAAGIHLILATQRPSVDVLTGLIKANIPTRIAFQVSSRIDSRTVLDQMGAEALLGNGDMLYLPPGRGVPERVHGAFVADHEVHCVVNELKRNGVPNYVDEIINGLPDPSAGQLPGEAPSGGGEPDPLYDEAVRVVTETRRASVSGVQRRLKIGYNRAARLVEEMESAGIVSPLQSNGSREVLAAPPPED